MWTTAGDLVTPDPVISMVPDHPLPRGPAGRRTPTGSWIVATIARAKNATGQPHSPFLPSGPKWICGESNPERNCIGQVDWEIVSLPAAFRFAEHQIQCGAQLRSPTGDRRDQPNRVPVVFAVRAAEYGRVRRLETDARAGILLHPPPFSRNAWWVFVLPTGFEPATSRLTTERATRLRYRRRRDARSRPRLGLVPKVETMRR